MFTGEEGDCTGEVYRSPGNFTEFPRFLVIVNKGSSLFAFASSSPGDGRACWQPPSRCRRLASIVKCDSVLFTSERLVAKLRGQVAFVCDLHTPVGRSPNARAGKRARAMLEAKLPSLQCLGSRPIRDHFGHRSRAACYSARRDELEVFLRGWGLELPQVQCSL